MVVIIRSMGWKRIGMDHMIHEEDTSALELAIHNALNGDK